MMRMEKMGSKKDIMVHTTISSQGSYFSPHPIYPKAPEKHSKIVWTFSSWDLNSGQKPHKLHRKHYENRFT